MPTQDPSESIARLKKQIDRVMLETARAGKDVGPLVADLKAIVAKAGR